MDKGIGLDRTIRLPWLDAAAAFCAEGGGWVEESTPLPPSDAAAIRARLEPVVGQDLKGAEARRKTIDILIHVWLKSRDGVPALHARAVEWFPHMQVPGDRLWLHYGLTLVTYAFFRQCLVAIGQFSRAGVAITTRMVKQRLAAERGHLGSLDRSTERAMASLRDWGVLVEAEGRHAYAPRRQAVSASSGELEAWLLACALHAHPAEELPFADLLRLPELYPFRFTLTLDYLRGHPWFAVQRQGGGWDMVRVVV